MCTVQRFHAVRPPPVTRSASTCVPFAMRVVFQPWPAANANGLRESLQSTSPSTRKSTRRASPFVVTRQGSMPVSVSPFSIVVERMCSA